MRAHTDGGRPWPSAPTRADVMVTLLLLTAAAWTGWADKSVEARGVRVEASGRTVFAGSLDSAAIVEVEGPLGRAVVEVAGGRARVRSAPCPGQICVAQGWQQHAGDVAACVPNRVVLRLTGTAAWDGVSR